MKKRLDYLDYSKAIGIVLVLFGHITFLQSGLPDYVSVVKQYIYAFHMPLFFVISGLEMGLRFDSESQFRVDSNYIKKQFKSLMIPFYIWSIIYIVLYCFYPNCSLRAVIGRVFSTCTAKGLAPIWFLAALFIARIVLAYTIQKANRISNRYIMNIWIILVLYAMLSSLAHITYQAIFKLIQSEPLSAFLEYPLTALFRVFPSVFFLACGFLAGNVFKDFKILSKGVRLFVGILLFLLFFFAQHHVSNSVNMHLFSFDSMPAFLFCGTTGSFSIILLCSLLPDSIKVLSFFGTRTKDIMLLHYPPFPTVAVIVKVFSFFSMNPSIYITTFIVLIITTSLSVLVLDPVRNIVNRILKRPR